MKYYVCLSWFLLTSVLAVEDLTTKISALSVSQAHHVSQKSSNATSSYITWTHSPYNGSNIYIDESSTICLETKKKGKRSFEIVYRPVKEFFSALNHDLYFKAGYGGRANHLFVSLRLGFKQRDQRDVLFQDYSLCWHEETRSFSFKPHNETSTDLVYADFYNLYTYSPHNSNWQDYEEINRNNKKIKFVMYSHAGIRGVTHENSTHSEPGALNLLREKPELFLNAIKTLPPHLKLKLLQIRLHSFLDFCNDCELMVHEFQSSYKRQLIDYLRNHLPEEYSIFSTQKEKSNRLLFMLNGLNNRFYIKKSYYFYNQHAERNHSFQSYFLTQYRPFEGAFFHHWNDESEDRLLTYINEPVGQSNNPNDYEDRVIRTDPNLEFMIPLNQAALYWKMAAKRLYQQINCFIPYVTPNLVMIDLSDARLGINEADDDYDGYSASHGAEVKNVISSLHICSQLKLLNLQGNWLGNFTFMTQFPNIVRNFTLLQSLNLANTALSERENLEKASEALIFLPQLEHLNLSSNGFNSDAFYGLMKGLCALNNIITLNLSYNRLAWGCNYEEDYKGRCEESTHDTLGWIVGYIHGTPSLKRVNVKNNSFGTIEFDWKDIKDEAGITTQELRRARTKLKIEGESGNDYSDSEEEYSDNEEEN